MDCAIRKARVGDISPHSMINEAEHRIDRHYLLPFDALTADGMKMLLEVTPIPVTRMSDDMLVALGEPRLLQAAQLHLDPRDRIKVLEYRGQDSEDVWTAMWARELRTLYTAPTPHGYMRMMNDIRGAIPTDAITRWCPSLRSARQFADATGVSRNILRQPPQAHESGESAAPEETPLERIRKGVHGE